MEAYTDDHMAFPCKASDYVASLASSASLALWQLASTVLAAAYSLPIKRKNYSFLTLVFELVELLMNTLVS